MTLKDIVKNMRALLEQISKDLDKAWENGNKTASQRVRTNTIKFAKLSKQYRKESIACEKGVKKCKKSTKKKVIRKRAPLTKKKPTKRRRSY